MKNHLLREIPKVDELLNSLKLRAECKGVAIPVLKDTIRQVLRELRSDLLSENRTDLPASEELYDAIILRARKCSLPSIRKVINGTGIVLHTNLGRSCMAPQAIQAAMSVSEGYSTLEYDVEQGKRGKRDSHIEGLLCRITGAESAMAVNNNAAAVLLILTVIAQGGEVIASRGELVEIGGGFRIPDIMESCGAVLREVGTTNKTHLWDYKRAINSNTRALMKVHTSNYRIVGFSETVSLKDLVNLAHENGLLAIEDLGSGCFVHLEQFGLKGEPTVMDSIGAGVDVVSFSGDKLLGGPQAGIIIGKKRILDQLKRHPLARAMRLDKMSIAALEATLQLYTDGTAIDKVPTLAMLAADSNKLQSNAQILCDMLTEKGIVAEVIEEQDQVGGGSVPTQFLKSYAVSILPETCSVDQLEEKLRTQEYPIIGRISRERYLLDIRTIFKEDFAYIARVISGSLL